MSQPPRPEPGVSYAAFPAAEFAEARSLEAAGSLAKFLGVTPGRALSLLEDPAAYAAEIRSRQSPETALRRAWRPGYPSPYGG
jgi:hypothetical protein